MTLLGISPREMKICVHTKTCIWMFISSFMHNNTKLEATQMSSNRWMETQTTVHPYYGILPSTKKDWKFEICNNLDRCPLSSFVTRERSSQEPSCLGIQDTDGQSGTRWEHIWKSLGILSFFLEILEIQNNQKIIRKKWLDECQLSCFLGILGSPLRKLGT